MSVTVLSGDEVCALTDARQDGEHLWVSAADLEAMTGWSLKPEGLCAEGSCVPLPSNGSWRDAAGRIDLAAFSRRLGVPLIHDGKHPVWALGASSTRLRDDMLSLKAPDFTLPDLDGNMHSLSDFRGKKVLLFAWASF